MDKTGQRATQCSTTVRAHVNADQSARCEVNSISDMGQASREETAREPAEKHLTLGQLFAPLFKSLNLLDKKIVPKPGFGSSEFQGPGNLSRAESDLLSNDLLAENAK